ncbi:MAG: homoserine kinase [Xanthomonadales bacterium]|nr:homoserine kinase [Xanthomonadales bacterium]
MSQANTPEAGAVASTVLRVYAPASVGNVSVGFDALGLALAPIDGTLLGDIVELRPASSESGELQDWQLSCVGPFAHKLPTDPEQNIVLKCCRMFQQEMQQRGLAVQLAHVTLEKNLPIGSGLGSSATSVVATLEALNRWHGNSQGNPFSSREIFHLMAVAEGGISGEVHLDNIAPCLYGGLRLCPPASKAEYALPWPVRWQTVVCWPGTELVTREARAVLPEQLPRKLVVDHGAQFAQFVYALYTGKTRLAAASMQDLIAEPHRRKLLPGFDEARAALQELGVLAVGISGSGPTVFAIADDLLVAEAAAQWLDQHYRQNDQGFVHVCRADLGGTRSVP